MSERILFGGYAKSRPSRWKNAIRTGGRQIGVLRRNVQHRWTLEIKGIKQGTRDIIHRSRSHISGLSFCFEKGTIAPSVSSGPGFRCSRVLKEYHPSHRRTRWRDNTVFTYPSFLSATPNSRNFSARFTALAPLPVLFQ